MSFHTDHFPPPRERLAIALGILWAAPLTFAGMLLLMLPILLARGRVERIDAPTPALLARGPFADWLLRIHPFGPMSAMAIGHLVIARRQGITAQILTHELAHVRQAAHWGIFFPLVYLAASAWALLRGEDAYWNNAFEVAARRAERQA